MKQLLIMVETNPRANTDWLYINAAIKRFYDPGRGISINHGYMGSKGEYKSRAVANFIKDKSKLGDTTVIMCIDTDLFEINPEQKKETEDIITFCKEKGYELIWFCHDIEEVFLGSSVPKAFKVARAKEYAGKNMIRNMQPEKLMSEKMVRGTSDFMKVLDKYMERKKE